MAWFVARDNEKLDGRHAGLRRAADRIRTGGIMLRLRGDSLRDFVTGLGVNQGFVVEFFPATEPKLPFNGLVPRSPRKLFS
jgi:hypothetical protein